MIPAQPLWSVLQETDLRFEETDQTVGTLLSVSKDKGIVRYSDLFPDRAIRAENHDRYKFVKSGSIVLNKMSASSGAVGVAKEAGIVSPDYAVLETKSFNNERFINYILGSADFCKNKVGPILRGIGTGDATSVRTPRVGMSEYLSLSIPVPPFETQQRIADYLDRETAEIDAAVADLDRYVKLLEKRGKVLIEKTVNGGTNSFSPLWSKIRVQNGFAFDSEKFLPTKELPVAKIGDVLPGDFSEFIDASELPSESFLIKDGDLVVGMSGDFNRTIWNKGKAALNQRVCILKPIGDDDIRYINYAIGSGLKKIHSTKFSTTLKNLSTEEILAIRVPHRTVTEQKEIATYLDKETAEINDLVVESTRLRDLLLKRRSVLITEVVTGRKQV